MNEVFAANLPLLKNIYGEAAIDEKETTLQRLFMETETAWQANLKRLKRIPVKYILITEAPCTEGDNTQYFYNRIESPFHTKIWKGVFGDAPIPTDMETAYRMLAEKGFLLIDSIPFSLKFAGKRDKKPYTTLIANNAAVLAEKLSNKDLTIAPDAIAAFAFKVNAQKMIAATGGKLTLTNGQEILLSADNIAADASGYTNSALLYKIFGLG